MDEQQILKMLEAGSLMFGQIVEKTKATAGEVGNALQSLQAAKKVTSVTSFGGGWALTGLPPEKVKSFLEKEMGFTGNLVYLSEPMTRTLGIVDDQKINKLRVAIAKSDDLAPELAAQGLMDIGVYMKAMGSKWTQRVLLKACDSIKQVEQQQM
jgi:hypothetical protein